MRFSLLAALLVFSLPVFSQHVIQGQTINRSDNKPIPFANIGIENTPVGTLSNEDGSFQIVVPSKYESDTILFSALGFERKSIAVLHLNPNEVHMISLQEKPITLKPVFVSAKKEKTKSYALGNRYTKGGFLYADSVSTGAAMALFIDNKYPSYYKGLNYPVMVEKVRVFIDKNSIDCFRLRVRFLQRDSVTNLPDKDLLSENVMITSSTKKGWLEVDLSRYHFVAHEPFYLVIEWIMDDQDRLALVNEYAQFRRTYPSRVKRDSTVVDGKKIGFWSYHDFSPGTHLGVSTIPFSLDHYSCYYRTNSFGEWKRSPAILTARVDVISLH